MKTLFQRRNEFSVWKTAFYSQLPIDEAMKDFGKLAALFKNSEVRMVSAG